MRFKQKEENIYKETVIWMKNINMSKYLFIKKKIKKSKKNKLSVI